MLTRVAITILLTLVLCLVGSPSNSKPKKPSSKPNKTAAAATAQDPPLRLSTTKAAQPGGGTAWTLTGRYQNAGRVVNLRASTIHVERTVTPQPPPPNAPSQEENYEPNASYYYADSEMTTSDGTLLAEAVYEFEQPTSHNMFYLTLHGVTLTFDLNSQQVTGVSEEDAAKVDAWLNTDDGMLVRQAGVALVEQGYQESDNEALLTYYLVAMTVGSDSTTQAVLKISDQREKLSRAHHASRLPSNPSLRSLGSACSEGALLADKEILVNALVPAMMPQCSGGCGPGCHVIHGRYNEPMYGQPCLNHDNCVANHGNWRLHPACWGQLVVAIAYVIYRW